VVRNLWNRDLRERAIGSPRIYRRSILTWEKCASTSFAEQRVRAGVGILDRKSMETLNSSESSARPIVEGVNSR
jgi:hypothetical protein